MINYQDRVLARYGPEAWRYLGWTAAGLERIERFKLRAVGVGMTRDGAEELWAGVELDQLLSPEPFHALREAERRLVGWVASQS